MKTVADLNALSDGKLYDINDRVEADAGGCEGCSACCHDVGDLFALTPYDVFVMKRHLKTSFDALLGDVLVLGGQGKVRLPHLAMRGADKRCAFLDGDGRCSIHASRPNVCKLFPLGRVYTDDDIRYFLQVDACTKPTLGKVEVKAWIGIENYEANKAFLLMWHQLLKAFEFRMKFVREAETIDALNGVLHDAFYRLSGDDFYGAVAQVLPATKERLGIL